MTEPDLPARRLADAAGPWPGFAVAAQAAVHELHDRFGLDLWMATHVEDGAQVVVASAGPWSAAAPSGTAFSWEQSFCLRMVAAEGPVAVPDVATSPAYRAVAVGELTHVAAYVGVPLLSTNERVFGTLCAFAGEPQPPSLARILDPVVVMARMLSTILTGEQVAADRSQDAATAYALAERDRLTGLRNRRGWETALVEEEQRCRRYGSAVSVLVLDLDSLKAVNDTAGHAAGDLVLSRCAEVLHETARPGDALSRTGGDEFGVLAVECDALCAKALAVRIRIQMRAAGIWVSVGTATRRGGEGLEDTCRRADAAMFQDKRRRQRRLPRTLPNGRSPAER